jgi:hypothetical protein
MRNKALLAPLLTIAMLFPGVPAWAELLIGGGVGAVLHEYVYSDLSTSGGMKTVFLEYRTEQNVGVRLEVAWLEFPDNEPGIPKSPSSLYKTNLTQDKPSILLGGGGVRLMWYQSKDSWITPFGSFSVGGYKVDPEDYEQIMLLLGPGFGVRLGRGRPSIGFELDMQMAVFQEQTMFMVPIKAYAAVGL